MVRELTKHSHGVGDSKFNVLPGAGTEKMISVGKLDGYELLVQLTPAKYEKGKLIPTGAFIVRGNARNVEAFYADVEGVRYPVLEESVLRSIFKNNVPLSPEATKKTVTSIEALAKSSITKSANDSQNATIQREESARINSREEVRKARLNEEKERAERTKVEADILRKLN